MKKRLIAVCATMIFCFSGCTLGSKTESKKNGILNKEAKAESNISYKYEKVNRDKKGDNGDVLLKWSYSYPVFEAAKRNEAVDKINSLIKSESEKFDESMIKANEFLFDKDSDISMYNDLPYMGFCQITVKRADEKVISLELVYSIFNGGAHSNQAYKGITLDASIGEEISFEKLSDNSSKLYSDVSSYADKLSSSKSYKELLNENVKINARDFIDNKKWYLSDSGIVLMSDPYEVACYAEGSVRFTVPYDSISIKDSYAYNGNYKLHSRYGYGVSADLNNDGKKEEVVVKGGYSVPINITVNDKEFGEDIVGYYLIDYYIVDLDKKDNYKEIALEVRKDNLNDGDIEYGSNLNDFTGRTYFYRYNDNSKLECFGYIDKLVGDCSIDYSAEKIKKDKKSSLTEKLTVEQGIEIIKKNSPDYSPDITIEHSTDIRADQFGITEETYFYYSYDEYSQHSGYMVGTTSGNFYMAPSNGDIYFELIKDGKVIKKYTHK